MMPRPAKTIPIADVPDFWARLGASATCFLGLDYDGTLAPFHVDPMQAAPLAGIPELLSALGEVPNLTVAIISGRPVSEVVTLVGELPVTIIGSHGFEYRRPDGSMERKHPRPKQREGLLRAREVALLKDLGPSLEVKIASIALHTRPMERDQATRVENIMFVEWSAVAEEFELECRYFNGGVEIRSLGWNKGDALLDLLNKEAEGTFAVYVGDDETDEDAFRAVRPYGIGIRVGESGVSTSAKGSLAGCQEVKGFLESWLTVCRSSRNLSG